METNGDFRMEGEFHRTIKQVIVEALKEKGYLADTEHFIRIRTDVYVKNEETGEEAVIEIDTTKIRPFIKKMPRKRMRVIKDDARYKPLWDILNCVDRIMTKDFYGMVVPKIMSKSTFYRWITTQEYRGKIRVDGKRDSIITVLKKEEEK